jgi:hypothetical protein
MHPPREHARWYSRYLTGSFFYQEAGAACTPPKNIPAGTPGT